MTAIRTTDYYLEVARGNVDGVTAGFIVGVNPDLGDTTTEAITDMGGNYTYLTADTQLYASSSSASDTSISVLVVGLDEDYIEVSRIVTVTGQTQVALSGLMFRVHAALVTGSTAPVGEIYIAESDTLTGGVPDTASAVKAKIPLSGLAGEPAEYASDNISHLGLYTVPAGKTLHFLYLTASVAKNQDATLVGRVRPFGGSWLGRSPTPLYQTPAVQEFQNRLPLAEKTDFELRAIAGNPNSEMQVQVQFVLVDN